MRRRLIIYFITARILACAWGLDTSLTQAEQAKVVVAKHLIELLDRPEASNLVKKQTLFQDSYWEGVFHKKGFSTRYSFIRPELKNAMEGVPLINGAPAEPRIWIKSVLYGLSPLPMVPISTLEPLEKKRIRGFAQGALKEFSSTLYQNPRDFEAAISNVAMEAGSVFQSGLIGEGFNQLGDLSRDVRLKQQEFELIDAKDRLNEALHLWGLHLVWDAEKLIEGQLNLSAYLIETKHVYDILGVSFYMYEVAPVVENEFYPALGHAEGDQGPLLLFGQTIDQQLHLTQSYLSDERASVLTPHGDLDPASVKLIDLLVRDSLSDMTDLRKPLIDTVGHHEGYHKFIDPHLSQSVRRGFFTENEKSVLHETGAYLYQLSAAQDKFILFDLLSVLATATSETVDFPANQQGAREALIFLQQVCSDIQFVTEQKNFLGPGLVDLFKSSPRFLKDVAERARLKYEVYVRNGSAAK
ncbi:MAG: hypothetical protein KCHDKBKB_01466 [Elusimicrobia bacterium]|nr:hypothetical protein [Elusimicrobiota bacterium]